MPLRKEASLFLSVVTLDQILAAYAYGQQAAASAVYALFIVTPGSPTFRVSVAFWLLVALIYSCKQKRIAVPCWVWSLLAAGWFGNALSVVRFGRFVDYLPVGLFITNVADVAITAGLAMLGYLLYKGAQAIDIV